MPKDARGNVSDLAQSAKGMDICLQELSVTPESRKFQLSLRGHLEKEQTKIDALDFWNRFGVHLYNPFGDYSLVGGC